MESPRKKAPRKKAAKKTAKKATRRARPSARGVNRPGSAADFRDLMDHMIDLMTVGQHEGECGNVFPPETAANLKERVDKVF